MPTEDKDDLTIFYSSAIVNPDYIDEIMGYGEQVASWID